MLQMYITPVEIGLGIGFIATLLGSLLFCVKNYALATDLSDQSLEGME